MLEESVNLWLIPMNDNRTYRTFNWLIRSHRGDKGPVNIFSCRSLKNTVSMWLSKKKVYQTYKRSNSSRSPQGAGSVPVKWFSFRSLQIINHSGYLVKYIFCFAYKVFILLRREYCLGNVPVILFPWTELYVRALSETRHTFYQIEKLTRIPNLLRNTLEVKCHWMH